MDTNTPPPMTIAQWHALPAKHRPTTVTITNQTIPRRCFRRQRKIISITLLNATHVADNAFDGCRDLHTVDAPQVTSIGKEAFWECSKLETVTLTALTTAGPRAFWACASIATISLPNLPTVPMWIFAYCHNLRIANLPMATQIDEWAFAGCVKLQPPTFMATVHKIGTGAFQECQMFQTLDMQHLNHLGTATFAGCTNLHEVFMPTITPGCAHPHAFISCPAIRLIQTTASFQLTTPLIIHSTRRMGKVERNFWTRRTHRAATTNIAKTLALAFNRLENPALPPELVSEIMSFLRRH
jgi:hypothetical protein